MKRSMAILSVIGAICVIILSCANNLNLKSETTDNTTQKDEATNQKKDINTTTSSQSPLNIVASFAPCGWMGDGESGKKYISYEANSSEISHSAPSCIKISYKPGPIGWAGIYWMYNKETKERCNWGDAKGCDLRGYTKITFWARGANGGEAVQFKAGGVSSPGKKFNDSFDYEPKLNVNLKSQWKLYTIDLSGKDLSSVIGGFCWVANSNVTFYLDDMQYE